MKWEKVSFMLTAKVVNNHQSKFLKTMLLCNKSLKQGWGLAECLLKSIMEHKKAPSLGGVVKEEDKKREEDLYFNRKITSV